MNSKIFKTIEIEVPTIPNYIRVGKQMIEVANFTEDEIKAIGKAWTEKLLEKQKRGKL